MIASTSALSPMPTARRKLLDASLDVIRQTGYAGTSVDELCAAAGVAKGSFFHHFKDKEALAVAAADHWSTVTGALFAAAPYHQPEDPLDRLLGYIAFRRALLDGTPAEISCVAGMLVQETFDSHPAIRDAGRAAIVDHAATVAADIEQAIARHGIRDAVTAMSLALHMQTVLQGAFILAKATGGADVARDAVDHLDRYVRMLFSP